MFIPSSCLLTIFLAPDVCSVPIFAASDASSGSYIAGHGAQNGGENESPPSEEEDDVSFSDYDDSLDEPQGPEYDDPTGVKFRRRQAAVRYRRLEADEIKKENEDLRAQSEHEKALAARREVRLKKVAAQEDLSGSTNVTSNADANSDNGAVDRPDIVAGLNEVTVSKSVTESEEGSSMPTTEKEEKGGMEVVDEESDSPSDDQEDLSPFVSLRNFSAAQAQKDVGNTLYSKGKWMEAIAAYSKAIELCPWSSDKDKERAIYYGNRAACYMAMAAEVERKEQGANANASANKSDTQHNAGSDPSKHGSGALQSLAELGSVFSNVSGYRCPTACVSLYEQCLYDCDVALSLNPEYVKVISRRASTLEKLGQLQDAKAGMYNLRSGSKFRINWL